MTTRRIRYGTPIQFRPATHAQLERFDNKPPPQPLEEYEPAAKTGETTKNASQDLPKTGKSTSPEKSPKAAEMRASEDNTSTTGGETTATQTAGKYPDWIPDGWDGRVTKYEASIMYLG